MSGVRAKKHLGQHFLTDNSVAEKIANVLNLDHTNTVLEVGPGTGVLTRYLQLRNISDLSVIEIDTESIDYLNKTFPDLRVIEGDFLKYDLENHSDKPFAVIGNFPYNISSQIFFKALDNKDKVVELAGMIQKEVAERICADPGSKTYGILSVLLRKYYTLEYLFNVPPTVFRPQPKVNSAVIRMTRNSSDGPDCDEKLLTRVIKSTFNQRRKMIRNSIKSSFVIGDADHNLLSKRPEQLSLEEFIELTNWVEEIVKN
ncbi:MAG: 16S rRNA (adenine(1518)-N(6)/adenine(1519)-N(6))-dimethyltransferase RsmA [Bacteroidales bacterium]|nr:16S rRNA (adenine(1518)-N(6)/adenine(1519)-N(6))-dimethyltransferase RsmA [Bacteroidales bacterium]